MKKPELSQERQDQIIQAMQGYFDEQFDEPLSSFRAQELLTFMLAQIGPSLYNQAIQDARGFMADKLDDLDTEFYLDESL